MDDLRRKQLEARAKSARKRRTEKSAPIVVEFAGSPKSGKSTNIDIVAHFFKRMGFKVWAPTEGASKRTPYHLKRDLVAFNTWSLNYAISELLVAFHNVDRHDLIILDRGPFDSIAWMSLLQNRGDLQSSEFNVFKEFALHPRWSELVSRVYLFTCSPEVSLRREQEWKLTNVPGTAMNKDMLSSLLKQYEALRKELKDYPVIPFDTTLTSGPLDTAAPIAGDIVQLLGKGRSKAK